jgi:hypothetical protein
LKQFLKNQQKKYIKKKKKIYENLLEARASSASICGRA